MIDIYPLSSAALTAPRRVTRYVLIWCASGEITVAIDGNHYHLTPRSLITITSGQYHFIREMKEEEGFVLEFTYDFFCKDDNDIELIFENGLFCHFDENQIINIPDADLIQSQLVCIEEELRQKSYQHQIVIHASIERILVEINRTKIFRGEEIWKPDALFLRFLELVRTSFDSRYPLSYYAERLNVPEQRLNDQAKLHTGKTAQMVIHSLIASEAKRLLIYESASIKEIAHKLGFSDPFYFSNFFKKFTDQSPKSFRELLSGGLKKVR